MFYPEFNCLTLLGSVLRKRKADNTSIQGTLLIGSYIFFRKHKKLLLNVKILAEAFREFGDWIVQFGRKCLENKNFIINSPKIFYSQGSLVSRPGP